MLAIDILENSKNFPNREDIISAGGKMAKIMIVDDDNDIIQFTERTLKRAGYQTCVAEDGQKALELLQEEKPDLILMDMMMPRMDGVKAIEELQKNKLTRDIPIIMISGWTKEMDLMKGLLVGPVGYIEKPLSPKKLLYQIEAQLKKTKGDQV
jgi:two-component system alkaline phosphatase synthesis response regulator PhoP